MSATQTRAGVQVLHPLGADARSESFLATVPGFPRPMVLRIIKADQPVDTHAFISHTAAVGQVSHPSLLLPRGAGVLPDGRAWVVTEHVDADTLAARTQLPIDALVSVGVHVAGALAALHAAGFTMGQLSARDLVLARTPVLDVSLAALSMRGAAPEADVHALAQVLIAAGAAGADRGPFESAVRKTLQGVVTAAALAAALAQLQEHWRASTAVSGEHPRPPRDTSEADLTGHVLGQYQLERLIGEGAMGRVYLGRHQRIGRLGAVKVLKAEHAASGELVQRFIQEAQAVNAIRNEHIVEIYDFGEEPQPQGPARVFCVMELLEGRSLADAIEAGGLSVQRVVRICQQLATALHAAHQLGVVHRDVKPENIFLHKRGADADFVKVLDFGVAKLLKPIGEIPKSGTQAGVVIGTPDYMAPEQALGGTTDFRVDIYAVGLVLYELLTGTRPFTAETFGRMVVEITTKPPPPLPPRTPWDEPIASSLAAIVLKCLEKEPAQRYQSAAALAQALEPFAYSGRTVPGSPASELLTEAETQAAVKGSLVPKLLATAVVLIVLGALGYSFVGRAFLSEEPPPSPVVVAPVQPPPRVEPTPAVPVAPAKVWLDVTSQPAGAKVTRLDTSEVLGVTPLKIELEPRDLVALKLELDGYVMEQRELALSSNASLSVDLTAVLRDKKKDPPKKKGPVSKDGTLDPFNQ